MATLANALIRDFPQYYPLFSLREFMWNNIRQDNRNGLLGKDPSVDGLKTGHTDSAGFCLATSANRNGMRLVSVVMGAPSIKAREDASAALLNYGYTFFETVRVKAAQRDGAQAARLQVRGGIRRRGCALRHLCDRRPRPGGEPAHQRAPERRAADRAARRRQAGRRVHRDRCSGT